MDNPSSSLTHRVKSYRENENPTPVQNEEGKIELVIDQQPLAASTSSDTLPLKGSEQQRRSIAETGSGYSGGSNTCEIHSILTLLRLLSLSSSSFDEQLRQSFRSLSESLEGKYCLIELDCMLYFKPFTDVITSPHANGTLTLASLSALCKFATYNFLRGNIPNIDMGVNCIADCIANCVFEESDKESDEVILLKLLELSTLLFQAEASRYLSLSSAWQVYHTCLSLRSHFNASKILKSEAETSLRHITLTVFSRLHSESILPSFPFSSTESSEAVAAKATSSSSFPSQILTSNEGILHLATQILTALCSSMNDSATSSASSSQAEQLKFALSLINISLEAGGLIITTLPPLVDILRGELCRHLLRLSLSENMEIFSLTLRTVYNLFMSIKDHMKVQLEVFLTSVHLRMLRTSTVTPASRISLAREEMTLESLLEFCREPSLMQDLYINYDCDVHCTNLFESIIVTLCQRSQPSPLSSSSSPPQTSPLYSSSIHQLAFQGVLAVLHSVANRVRQVSSTLPTAQESVVLPEVGSNLDEKDNVEEQVDAWCDQCEDVLPFSSRISSSPTSFTSTLSPPPSRTVSRELGFDQGQGDALTLASTAEVLRARRRKKEQLRRVAGLFNEKPLKDDWLALAMELGFIKEKSLNITQVASENVRPEGLSADAISVANFLKNTPLLGKIQVGEYLSRGPKEMFPFHADVLKAYVSTFDLSSTSHSFDASLRLFLGSFRLPGESQCIDRLMEAFSVHLFQALGKGKPFYTADAAFILSFSTIMLNTDLHSSRIPAHKKMKKEEFIANNRGINEGEDLPVAYLSALYDGIRDNQITLEAEVSHSLGSGGTLNSSSAAASILDADVASWNQLILKRGRSMVPALFTSRATSHSSALSASSSFSSSFSYEHERDMFQVISQEVWHTLIASLLSFNNISSSYSAPDRLLLFQKTITGVNDFFSVALSLHVIDVLNKSFQSLVSTLTNLLSSREENDQMPPATSTDLNYYNTSMMERLQMVLQQRTMIQWKELTIRVSAADGTTTLSSDLLLLFSECVLQLVCEVFALCINTLDSASLRQFFHLLLWCRRRGALPDALLKSTQHSQEDEDSITISVFGHHCYSHARGYSIHRHISSSSASSSSSSPASVWSRVNSLFFDTSGPYPSSASSFHALVSSESIINTCSVHLETHLPFFLPRQRLLRTALEHSSLTSTLFSLSTSSSCSALPSVLQSLLAVLTEGLHHLTSNSAAAASSSLAEGLEASSLCLFQEIDAVAILCWIKRLMDINTSHHWFVICWPPIQGFLSILFNSTDELNMKSVPFLVEKVSEFILENISFHLKRLYAEEDIQTSASDDAREATDLLFDSMRLLKLMPNFIMEHNSLKIAKRLCGILRIAAALFPPQPYSLPLVSVTHWHTLFSTAAWACSDFLPFSSSSSPASSSDECRALIWTEIVTAFITPTNAIHALNFTPCRHLVLRFLHNVFLRAEEVKEESISFQIQRRNWQAQASIALLKLTLRALAGHIRSGQSEGRTISVLFSVPAIEPLNPSFSSSSVSASMLDFEATPIYFQSAVDVPALWIESIKTFCDVATSNVSSSSSFHRHAKVNQTPLCIKCLLRSGADASLPGMIWLTAIVEMVAKLPLNLQRIMPHKAVNGEELAALAEVCLKYCQLVTDVWVEQFQVLLQSDGCEATFSSFGSTWLAYIRILAVNLSISPTTSCLHDSMLGQLGSLLQLLQICPSLDAGTRTEVEGNGHWRSRLLEESWKAALKEYSDLPQQLMPLHPSLVKQSDRSSSSSNFTT